ncbi:hypothetical protein Bbelb_318010 [Branchiostoma belcheri]|nr:hypothetical protein Bbelb_318010 [Branchiostoma belcheri]
MPPTRCSRRSGSPQRSRSLRVNKRTYARVRTQFSYARILSPCKPDNESAQMLNFNRDIKSTKQALEGAERASGGATYYIKGPAKHQVELELIAHGNAVVTDRRGGCGKGSCPNISLEGCEHLHELNERCKFTLLVVPRASIKYYKSLYNSDYLQDDSMTRQALESKPSIRIMELEGQAKFKMNGIAAAEFLDKLSVENPDKYETMLSTIRRKRREFHNI